MGEDCVTVLGQVSDTKRRDNLKGRELLKSRRISGTWSIFYIYQLGKLILSGAVSLWRESSNIHTVP